MHEGIVFYVGPESEPFIVQLSCEDDQHVLVSLTEKYLLEKDLDGRIIEKLDIGLLQCIVTVDEAATEAAEMDTGQDVPVVKLTFDYVRKDRRERMYIMEDQENAQVAYCIQLYWGYLCYFKFTH